VFLAGEDLTQKRLNEEIGVTLRKSADQTVNNTTTMVNDTHLTWPVDALGRYVFDMELVYTAATAADIRIGWGSPTGTAMSWSATGLDTALAYKNVANLAAATTSNFGGNGVASGRVIHVSGYVDVGATAGSFTLRWAQDTANASDASMRTGSAGTLYRV
jgi:hypothetical protein